MVRDDAAAGAPGPVSRRAEAAGGRAAATGALELLEVQLEGRKRIAGRGFRQRAALDGE